MATANDVVWWLGDLFSNTSYTKPGLVYVSDGAAWLDSVRHALTAHPPTIVVLAHGDPVTEDTASKTADLLK